MTETMGELPRTAPVTQKRRRTDEYIKRMVRSAGSPSSVMLSQVGGVSGAVKSLAQGSVSLA